MMTARISELFMIAVSDYLSKYSGMQMKRLLFSRRGWILTKL